MPQPPESDVTSLLAQVCRLEHARSHELLEELGLYRGQHRIFELFRHVWRKSHGRDQAVPVLHHHLGVAELDRARDVRQRPEALHAQHHDRADLIGLHQRQQHRR